MRTKIALQVARVTCHVSKPKLLGSALISFSILIALLVGCTSANTAHDTSSAPDTAQQKPTSDKNRSQQKAQIACELLTPNEIAGILKTPQVVKDETDSRKNDFTKVDFCYWWPNGKVNPDRDERIELRLR